MVEVGVEDDEGSFERSEDEPGDRTDSGAPCSWVYGGLEWSRSVGSCGGFTLEAPTWRKTTHESQNVSVSPSLKSDLRVRRSLVEFIGREWRDVGRTHFL